MNQRPKAVFSSLAVAVVLALSGGGAARADTYWECVTFARMFSGIQIFGDAATWWNKAAGAYSRGATPQAGSVLVFKPNGVMGKGHVAVVTRIVNPREVIVDHANWQNRGEIDHNTPVLDVSVKNDWSKVRVWDINSAQWGVRVYKLSGFIAGHAPALAAAGS